MAPSPTTPKPPHPTQMFPQGSQRKVPTRLLRFGFDFGSIEDYFMLVVFRHLLDLSNLFVCCWGCSLGSFFLVGYFIEHWSELMLQVVRNCVDQWSFTPAIINIYLYPGFACFWSHFCCFRFSLTVFPLFFCCLLLPAPLLPLLYCCVVAPLSLFALAPSSGLVLTVGLVVAPMKPWKSAGWKFERRLCVCMLSSSRSRCLGWSRAR